MKAKKIYLASSWKNGYFPSVYNLLIQYGFDVYNFRNPKINDFGFSWNEIDKNWDEWFIDDYLKALNNPKSVKGYDNDFAGMQWCDICVLLLPSGRSAHLEAGYIKGQNKKLIIHIPQYDEPDLMYKLADGITKNTDELLNLLQ